jgi:hypothetical protein
LTIEVRDVSTATHKPVISFVPQEEEKNQREATIVTSLDKVLGKASGEPRPAREPSMNTSRVVSALIRAGRELVTHHPLEGLFSVILELSLSAVEARRGVILTLEEGELVVIEDAQNDSRTDKGAVKLFGDRSILVAPLLARKVPVFVKGVLLKASARITRAAPEIFAWMRPWFVIRSILLPPEKPGLMLPAP